MEGKIIIGFAGEIASGKDSAVNYLEKNHEVLKLKFSQPLSLFLT